MPAWLHLSQGAQSQITPQPNKLPELAKVFNPMPLTLGLLSHSWQMGRVTPKTNPICFSICAGTPMEKCLLCLVLEETSAWCNAHKKTTLERSGRWWRAACTQQGAPWDGGFTKSNTRKPRRVCRVFRFHIFKEKSTLALKTQKSPLQDRWQAALLCPIASPSAASAEHLHCLGQRCHLQRRDGLSVQS